MTAINTSDLNITVHKPVYTLTAEDHAFLNPALSGKTPPHLHSHFVTTNRQEAEKDVMAVYLDSKTQNFDWPVNLARANPGDLKLAIQSLNNPDLPQSFDQDLKDKKEALHDAKNNVFGFTMGGITIGAVGIFVASKTIQNTNKTPSSHSQNVRSGTGAGALLLASVGMFLITRRISRGLGDMKKSIAEMTQSNKDKRQALIDYAKDRLEMSEFSGPV